MQQGEMHGLTYDLDLILSYLCASDNLHSAWMYSIRINAIIWAHKLVIRWYKNYDPGRVLVKKMIGPKWLFLAPFPPSNETLGCKIRETFWNTPRLSAALKLSHKLDAKHVKVDANHKCMSGISDNCIVLPEPERCVHVVSTTVMATSTLYATLIPTFRQLRTTNSLTGLATSSSCAQVSPDSPGTLVNCVIVTSKIFIKCASRAPIAHGEWALLDRGLLRVSTARVANTEAAFQGLYVHK